MAFSAAEIEVVLRARDLATATLRQAEQQVQSLANASGENAASAASMGNAWSAVSKILATVGIVKIVGDVVSLAGEMDDLSQKTGISIEALNRLKLAAELNGTSLSSLTNAIIQLGARLNRGEDSAVAAIAELGLNLEDLQRLSPDQQFIALARALQNVHDPARQAFLAIEIGGRSMSEVLGVLKSDVKALETGTVGMSANATKSLALLGDQFAHVRSVSQGALGESIAGLMKLHEWLSPNVRAARLWADEMERAAKATQTATTGSNPAIVGRFSANVSAAQWDGYLKAQKDAAEAAKKAEAELERYNARVKEQAAIFTGKHLAAEVKFWADALREAGGEANLTAHEHEQFGRALNELVLEGAKLPPELHKIFVEHLKLSDLVPEVTGHIDRQVFAITNAWPAVEKLGEKYLEVSRGIKAIDDAVNASPLFGSQRTWADAIPWEQIEKEGKASRDAAHATADAWVTAFDQIGQAAGALDADLGRTIQNFGRIIEMWQNGDIGGRVVMAADGISGVIQAQHQGSRGKGALAGAQAGMAIGSFAGPIGMGVGAAAGAIYGALSSGGPGVNDVRDQWMAHMGGLQTIQEQIGAFANDPVLMSTFQRLYTTDQQEQFIKAAEAFEKRMRELMGEQEGAHQRLQKAIEKYGFTIDELGPKLQQQKLSEQAKELIMDYTALTAAGIDVGLVTEKMAAAVNEYLAIALRTGIEVPQAMRPMLEKMVEMGLLTNENGEKLTDLKTIPFAETLSQGFDRVIAKLDELIRKLVNDLPDAIYDIPDVEVGVSGPGEQAGPTRPPSLQNPGGGESPIGAATGAYVMAKPGGTHMIVGEGGEDEVILPVSRLGGGNHYSFNISTLSPREFSEFLKDGGISVIVSQVEDNVRGSRTGLQQAVGLPVK